MLKTAATNKHCNGTTVLVIDDDPKLLAFVASQLHLLEFRAEMAESGEEGLEKAARLLPGLIILDISLPGMGGMDVLERLREWFDGPIIILSAIDEEGQKVEALDMGADDYLTKPFSAPELLARVRSALRRATNQASETPQGLAVIEAGYIKIDMASRTVSVMEQNVSLTRTEYELLRCLASNLGKIMSHRELLQEVWGPEYGEEAEYLRTFIKQLRRKLERVPSRPEHLLTQPGIGYRLVAG